LELALKIIPAFTPTKNQVKAYIQIIVFDKDYKYIRSEKRIVSKASLDNCGELLEIAYTMPTDGYVQVMTVNESPNQSVWFDDIELVHQENLITQETHYDAFGLELAGIEKTGKPEFDWKFTGKESIDDLDLGWTDFGARQYDPALARWHSADPIASKYFEYSPYNYVINNPMKYVDPKGLDIVPVITSSYNAKTRTTTINVTFNVKVAVLNNSSRKVSTTDLASNIQKRLEKALTGSTTTNMKDGSKIVTNFKAGNIEVEAVSEASEVQKDQHLVVVVDDATGKAVDKNGKISNAGGRAAYGAKVAYTEWNSSTEAMGSTSVHELGHNFNLKHNWDAGSPSDARSNENYMSYENGQTSFSPQQLEAIKSDYFNHYLNRGGNTTTLQKDDYSFGTSTEKKPYTHGNKGQKVPLAIDDTGK
jgi:RHS repeat-associated protein